MGNSKNTKPEILIRQYLFSWGFRYKLHVKNLPGTPDIVFAPKRLIVFINGCFWHQHGNCKKKDGKSSLSEYWLNNFAKSIKRDLRILDQLKELGWEPLVLWECEIELNAFEEAEKVANAIAIKRQQRS
jgi:DNA mismatch endonuclease, patch repair protein